MQAVTETSPIPPARESRSPRLGPSCPTNQLVTHTRARSGFLSGGLHSWNFGAGCSGTGFTGYGHLTPPPLKPGSSAADEPSP